MKVSLGVLGTLSLVAGLLVILLAKTSIHETTGAMLIGASAAALGSAAVVDAVGRLRKAIEDRPTAGYAADKVGRQIEELRSEVKALRSDLEDRANEVRSS